MNKLQTEISNLYFQYRAEKSKLEEERKELEKKIETLSGVMFDLEILLSKNECVRIYDHYESENKEQNNEV